MRRLHEKIAVQLPNIQEVPLYSLTPFLAATFFDSLREGYPEFDDWFRAKARRDGVRGLTGDGLVSLVASVFTHTNPMKQLQTKYV